MKLTVETRNFEKFNSLINFLTTNGYKVNVEKKQKLTDNEWCLPGKPATDEEHEAHAVAMENESEENTLTTKQLKTKFNKWKKIVVK